MDGDLRETQRWWASAIAATGVRQVRPLTAVPLHEAAEGELACSHPGQFAVSDVDLGGGRTLTVISLYGIWQPFLGTSDKYPEGSLHRALSDLTPVIEERGPDNVLIGGDLNLWSYSPGSVRGDRWMTVFTRLKDAYDLTICGPYRREGEARLDRCPCPDIECRHVNTFLYAANTANVPYQLDFFLATENLRARHLVASWADPDPAWFEHSDHRAVFATFDL
jgi:hypothetical protein